MAKQIYGQIEIEALLEKLRVKTKGIGTYVSHTLADELNYKVTLSNGSILLYQGELKDAAGLPDFRVVDIAARFRTAKP